jgi:hypothetical protein
MMLATLQIPPFDPLPGCVVAALVMASAVCALFNMAI